MNKTCAVCKIEKPEAMFARDKTHADGRSYTCKACAKIRLREFYLSHKDRFAEYGKRYRQRHPEKAREARRRFEHSITRKNWLERTKQQRAEYRKKYRHLHIDERRAYDKERWQTIKGDPELHRKRNEQVRKNMRKCYEINKQRWRINHQLRKRDLFEHYGGCRCLGCGETDIRCLSIDHIDNNGNKHRQELFGDKRQAGVKFYSWLKRNNYPAGFQVLCMNCQWIKRGNGGVLPPLHDVAVYSLSEYAKRTAVS